MAITLRKLKRVSYVFPAATLDAVGNLVEPWQPTSTTREDWGIWRTYVDNVDRSTYRDVRTIPTSWSFVKPHWYGDAEVWLPQVTKREALPSWCALGKDVKLWRELAGGTMSTDVRDRWWGYVVAVRDANPGTILVCEGAYQQANLYVRAPGLRDDPLDVSTLHDFNLNNTSRAAYRFPVPVSTLTTKTTRQRGAWERTGDYLAGIEAAVPGWTWRPTSTYAPELVNVTTSPGLTNTIRFGQWGCNVSDVELTNDIRGRPNVIYAEGSVNGVAWRYLYVQSTGDPYFQPISYDPKVHTIAVDVNGNLYTDASQFDAGILRIEAFWRCPPGMTPTEAKTIADAFRAAVATQGYAGRVRLTSSPNERSLLDIRPDDTLALQGYRGANHTLHVAEARYDWNEGKPTVDLTVDTNARDLATLEAMLAEKPDFEQATNPFARVVIGAESGLRHNRRWEWDYEKSGWGPNDPTNGYRFLAGSTATFPIAATGWTRYGFLASERDTIMHSQIVVSTGGIAGVGGRRFVAAVYDRYVTIPGESPPSPLPSNPLADGAWESIIASNSDGFLWGWGGSFRDPITGAYVVNAAGYGHIANKWESQGDAVTGQMLDDTPWPYNHDNVPDANKEPARLYLYVYNTGASAVCWFRFAKGPSGA